MIASIGPGIDIVLQREVATRPVAYVHEVEQLREPALTLGFHRQHLMHALVDDLARRVEPEAQPLVLESVPELDERDQLTRDVAVLAPRADLVVAELGIRVPEARAPSRSRSHRTSTGTPRPRRAHRRRTRAGSCGRSAAPPRAPRWPGPRLRHDTHRAGAPAAAARACNDACAPGAKPRRNNTAHNGATNAPTAARGR